MKRLKSLKSYCQFERRAHESINTRRIPKFIAFRLVFKEEVRQSRAGCSLSGEPRDRRGPFKQVFRASFSLTRRCTRTRRARDAHPRDAKLFMSGSKWRRRCHTQAKPVVNLPRAPAAYGGPALPCAPIFPQQVRVAEAHSSVSSAGWPTLTLRYASQYFKYCALFV